MKSQKHGVSKLRDYQNMKKEDIRKKSIVGFMQNTQSKAYLKDGEEIVEDEDNSDSEDSCHKSTFLDNVTKSEMRAAPSVTP
jgi:hypothetical protein